MKNCPSRKKKRVPDSLIWAEIKCLENFALPRLPINWFQPVWQNRQQAQRAYCPNIHTVTLGFAFRWRQIAMFAPIVPLSAFICALWMAPESPVFLLAKKRFVHVDLFQSISLLIKVVKKQLHIYKIEASSILNS